MNSIVTTKCFEEQGALKQLPGRRVAPPDFHSGPWTHSNLNCNQPHVLGSEGGKVDSEVDGEERPQVHSRIHIHPQRNQHKKKMRKGVIPSKRLLAIRSALLLIDEMMPKPFIYLSNFFKPGLTVTSTTRRSLLLGW